MLMQIVIAVVILVVIWFALGTLFNVRKGYKALEWLQGGLKQLGEKTTLRWLGSSAVDLRIQDATEPFRQIEVVVVLEPRDVPLLWGYYHARGRRDLLIVRAQMRDLPPFETEVFDPSYWSAHGVEERLRFRNWNQLESSAHNLVAYAAGPAADIAGLLATATLSDCTPVRVAIRRTDPNLEVHWNLDDVQQISADHLFRNLRKLPLGTARERRRESSS